MARARKVARGMLEIIIMLAILQLARYGMKSAIFLFVDRTNISDRAVSMACMAVLSALIALTARRRGRSLSVFPARFGAPYIAATVIALALIVLTPIITGGNSPGAILLLVYSAVVVPVFEELIFRSVVWEKLKGLFKREWVVYLVDSALFALWHLGYADSLALRVKSGLAEALMWKAVTGLCYGLVLGAVRLKTKNSYSTMLLHGVMNVFGR